MTITQTQRTIIKADEGKILTNGTVYGTEIILSDTDSVQDYREITCEQYEEITASEETEV